ncbi:FAD-dependent oxidoreductase [Prauserella alba]|uniref:N-methyl-L-tryptophan oxidase n=1 Tax=Prauserella alba TaxID=176898 RepID=A0ABN1VKX6_9PSEU|nr:FAD-dependent oxidoreductase [Prauserella alba]
MHLLGTGLLRIAVVGLGAIGSQVLWQLSRRPDVDVHGFESSYPGHPEAGAGGESRLYRNFETDDPAYEPVIHRADALWRELEVATARRLRCPTGVLLTGDHASPQLQRALESADRSGKPSRTLAPDELRVNHPQLAVSDTDIGLWDPQGGVIRPELTVSATVGLATGNGAVVHDFTRVTSVDGAGDGVRVRTSDGARTFDRVVIACGGWTTTLRPDLRDTVVVRRLTSAWFHGEDDDYLRGMVPFMRTAPSYCYGIPAGGGSTIKLGLGFNDHHPVPDPDAVARTPAPEEAERFSWIVDDVLPGLQRRPVRMSTYLESYTTSMHDYIGFDRQLPGVVLLTGFSGHGFKVSPAIGEIGAQLATQGESDIDVGFLRDAPPVFDIVDPETGRTTHNHIVSSRPPET